MKRCVIVADLHAGHRAGLTAPDWHGSGMGRKKERRYWERIQKDLYAGYMTIVDRIGPPIDLLISNGDCIDGRGERNGGTELTTNKRREQCEMAIELLKVWEPRQAVFLAGSPYHTGHLEDWEEMIARAFDAELESHACVEIKSENVVIDVKHKIGRSTIPHGRGTAALREKLWNALQAVRGEAPLADMIVRSHVHYFIEIQDADGIAMITPGLQAARSHYGEREVSGVVDWGLIFFQAEGGKIETSGSEYVKKIEANKMRVVTV